jgi:hypothetical protein
VNIGHESRRDFFLGRNFRNLGGNRKFRYPTRNWSTGQKISANLNLNSDLVSNKEVCVTYQIEVCGVVIIMRTVMIWPMVLCSISPEE